VPDCVFVDNSITEKKKKRRPLWIHEMFWLGGECLGEDSVGTNLEQGRWNLSCPGQTTRLIENPKTTLSTSIHYIMNNYRISHIISQKRIMTSVNITKISFCICHIIKCEGRKIKWYHGIDLIQFLY